MTAIETIRRLFQFDAEKEIDKKTCLIFFSAIICLLAFITILRPFEGEVIRDYFYYSDAIINGVAPYEPYNDMNWEYPPLSYFFMLIPRLFTSDPVGYQIAYVVMITSFLLVGLYIIRQLALKYARNAKTFMSVYVLTIAMMLSFTFDRFDIIVAIITLASIYLYLEKKYPWAFLLIAVGMLVKLYPGLLFPVFLMPLITSKNREWLKGLAVFCISSVLMLAPFIIWSPDTFLTFVTYHSDRGVQIESVASSFILLLEMLGLTSTQTVSVSWALDIQGGAADMIAPILMPLLIVVIIMFYLAYYLCCRKENDQENNLQSVAMASFAMIMIFVVFNKVFSGQYVIWILTAVIPFAMLIKKPEQSTNCMLLFISMIVLSVYSGVFYKALCYHDPFGVTILLIRNLMVVTLMIMGLKYSGMFDGHMSRIKDYAVKIVKRLSNREGRSV